MARPAFKQIALVQYPTAKVVFFGKDLLGNARYAIQMPDGLVVTEFHTTPMNAWRELARRA